MTCCVLSLLLVATQTIPDPNGLATLDGQVIQGATQEPILKARVTLESTADGHETALVATTDGVGHFRFVDVPSGTYNLTVEKDGFLDGGYGESKPTDRASLLKINAGDQVKEVILKLFPAAIISGRVLDADGDPVSDAEVHLWIPSRRQSDAKPASVGTAVTNHAGEYSLDNLPAGVYYVSANETSWKNAVRQIVVDSTGKPTKLRDLATYYPEVLSFAEAQAISVQSGQEQPDIDIRLQRGPTMSVKGTVAGAGKLSSTYEVIASSETGLGWTSETARLLPNGEFLLEGLPPGAHRLILLDAGANGFQEIGRTEVNLTDQDLTGVVLVPFKPAQVRVQVFYEGEEDRLLTAGSVFLYPVGEHSGSGVDGRLLMQFQPQNSTYVIDNVPPGKYRLLFNNASGAYIKSVMSEGQMLDGDSVTVNDGATLDVKMMFSKHVASLDGDVERSQDQLEPSNIRVTLVPEDAVSFSFGKGAQSAALDPTFHFSMQHLRPGKYLAAATQQDDSSPWDNPDFVQLMRSEGTELELPENGHATVHLKVISKDVTDRLRRQLGI